MKKIRIKLNDYSRILLSETSPDDVPIIFSNNWFYYHKKNINQQNRTLLDIINYLLENRSLEKYFIPMRYKIRKDDVSFRHMGLLHPAIQSNMVDFLKTYSHQLLYFCDQSEFSIRYPKKIASTFYFKNKLDNTKLFKGDQKQRLSDENKFKHATSYYAYNRHTKLHQFFDHEEFFRLEGKYTQFWSIDISKCFDSIYTHSIEWATKGKYLSKKIGVKDTFGSIFDRLMQRSNFNETHGIIIGNEISRVFAEIILQKIDRQVKDVLSMKNIEYKIDYEVRRYVDDYLVFSTSIEIIEQVVNCIEDCLRQYKLYLNKSKTKKFEKPFITGITRSKIETLRAISELYSILFEYDDNNIICTKKKFIRNSHSVILAFINKIKSSCNNDKESYNAMSGYIISAFFNKCVELSSSNPDPKSSLDFATLRDSYTIILKISFHLFSVNPSFTNSIKLSKLCYISYTFFETTFLEEEKTIKLLINNFIKEFFASGKCKQLLRNGSNYFPIEFVNLLFVSRNMGKDYLLNHMQIKEIFDLEGIKNRNSEFHSQEENTDYFQLMSLLYYIGDEIEYSRIRQEAVKLINNRLINLDSLTSDAKSCYLFLDSMACPFIDNVDKIKWAKRFAKYLYPGRILSDDDVDDLKETLATQQWFISWHYPDLWNILEKKELLFDY